MRIALNLRVSDQTVYKWLNSPELDIRLTTPDVLHVITDELKIPSTELLVVS
jgi:hypothetical protein